MKFIGQKDLVAKFSSYTIATLPNPIMLIGAHGCGKHTIVSKFARDHKLDIINIDPNIDASDLVEYNLAPVHRIYLIDMNALTEKAQNKFLKFIEEPSPFAHIILIADSVLGILPTVQNRCHKEYFQEYTKDELYQVEDAHIDQSDYLAYQICKTPGDLINYSAKQAIKMDKFIDELIKRGKNTNVCELMRIVQLMNYKEDYNKFDFSQYFNLLISKTFKSYVDGDEFAGELYFFTSKYMINLQNKALNKEAFMINYVINLWQEVYTCN